MQTDHSFAQRPQLLKPGDRAQNPSMSVIGIFRQLPIQREQLSYRLVAGVKFRCACKYHFGFKSFYKLPAPSCCRLSM